MRYAVDKNVHNFFPISFNSLSDDEVKQFAKKLSTKTLKKIYAEVKKAEDAWDKEEKTNPRYIELENQNNALDKEWSNFDKQKDKLEDKYDTVALLGVKETRWNTNTCPTFIEAIKNAGFKISLIPKREIYDMADRIIAKVEREQCKHIKEDISVIKKRQTINLKENDKVNIKQRGMELQFAKKRLKKYAFCMNTSTTIQNVIDDRKETGDVTDNSQPDEVIAKRTKQQEIYQKNAEKRKEKREAEIKRFQKGMAKVWKAFEPIRKKEERKLVEKGI